MNTASLRWCTHAGLAYALLLGVGVFGIAGWLPLPKPGLGADQIAALFQQDQTAIRIGISMIAGCTVLFWPFAVAISHQMQRIEGPSHPLADVQRTCATGTVIAVLLPAYLWLAMAFRPEQTPPVVLQLANDFAFFCFVGMWAPATLQAVVIGFCILSAPEDQQVYPRWLGYMNLWLAVLFLPGVTVPFFKAGPFAWNGLITFWVVATAFWVWLMVMWWATLKALPPYGLRPPPQGGNTGGPA